MYNKLSHRTKSFILRRKAQATIEFVFAFIVLVVMVYGAVKAMQWLGVALVSPIGKYHKGLYAYPHGEGASTSNPHFNPVAQLDSAGANTFLPRMKLTFDGEL